MIRVFPACDPVCHACLAFLAARAQRFSICSSPAYRAHHITFWCGRDISFFVGRVDNHGYSVMNHVSDFPPFVRRGRFIQSSPKHPAVRYSFVSPRKAHLLESRSQYFYRPCRQIGHNLFYCIFAHFIPMSICRYRKGKQSILDFLVHTEESNPDT